MCDSVSFAPIWLTDVVGSLLMVILSVGAIVYARRLSRREPHNAIWIYLLWLSVALCGFALSRAVGHIVKPALLALGKPHIWALLKPYSGSFNTLAFVLVASITLFFQRVHQINAAILVDRQALQHATKEVMRLNQGLGSLVRERTEELSRSERKYRRIFEGSMDMIFILDGETRVLDVNGAGLDALGYAHPEDVLGKVILRDLFASHEQFDQLVAELHAVGYVRDRETILRVPNGSEKYFLLSATRRTDNGGEIVAYEGIAKDITARVSMQRQLQQADKLASLGQISTGIAHEINNPLGVMLGYTQLLLRDHPPGTQIHDDLKTIEKHARNCKNVVEDLLKFARGTRTKKATTNVNQGLAEVVSLLVHQFELDNVRISTDLAGDLPDIEADSEKLKQVFMNLLMNAKQAVRGQGEIRVKTGIGGKPPTLQISISDSGSGIDPGHLNKIFDPFFTTKPVGEGTGLGLSVSYGIVQDHSGRIDVQSQPGKGSTFTVVLPLDAAIGNREGVSNSA
jgi:two-component system, NtrC family, sensor kinase